jgi:hypothetical protein
VPISLAGIRQLLPVKQRLVKRGIAILPNAGLLNRTLEISKT